jgi:chromate transporter
MSEIKPVLAPRPGSAGLVDLFVAFLQISLSGFGGAINWAHRALVEKRRWMTDEDFTEMLSLCQFLPGPNIVNFAVCLGQRQQGISGSIAALSGSIVVPFCIFLLLALFYSHLGKIDSIHGALTGVSAAAAGFMITVGVRLARPHRQRLLSLIFGTAAFIAMGVIKFPLVYVLLALAPPSIIVAWFTRA